MDEFIDLTSSFTLADHCLLANEIINLDSDESFDFTRETKQQKTQQKKKVLTINTSLNENKKSSSKVKTTLKDKEKPSFGECPICWDKLGNNPLASTKCGHVYCLKCLEKSLSVEKKCPTCRCILKGSSAYHPLYLTIDNS